MAARALRPALAALIAASTAAAAAHDRVTAQDRVTAVGEASATVVRNLQVQPLADLHFGAIVVGRHADGAVQLGTSGEDISYSGSARSGCSASAACQPHPALFRVVGEASRTYRITIADGIMAEGAATGVVLAVDALSVASENFANGQSLGQLDDAGQDRFTVGGTLLVPAGTRPDIFRADLPVVVNYE